MTDDREDTRERLLQAATTLFAKHGYDGTSVKQLSEEAGANISLISYHFGGKEGLYRACIEQFGRARLAAAQRVLQSPSSLQELQIRLSMFFEELLITHVESPEITSIIHRECQLEQNSATEDIFRNSFIKSFQTLVEFLCEAQKNGIIDAGFDAQILGGLAFGAIIHAGRADQINRRYFQQTISDPIYRKKVIDHAVRAITAGFLKLN